VVCWLQPATAAGYHGNGQADERRPWQRAQADSQQHRSSPRPVDEQNRQYVVHFNSFIVEVWWRGL